VTKKFHTYASVAYDPVVPPTPTAASSVDDARDAFLVELASFHLSLKKSLMVCEAEARQVEEYQREKERIGECSLAILPAIFSLTRNRNRENNPNGSN
jgi:THO complex subunit 7